MSTVVRDAYRSIGVSFNAEAISRGYYPRGGGRVTVEIEPASRILPTVHTPPEASPAVRLSSRCGKLPRHVAERQLAAMQDVLASRGVTVVSRAVTVEESLSPGSSCLASAVGEGRWIGADGIGAKGRPAEDVGKDVGTRMCSTLETGASFDQNLADMIAPLLALAPGPSFLLVPEVTLHLRTCMQVASLFTGCSFTTSASGRASNVEIFPGPRHNA
jgi:RNA 3'-terminal phosphate cyclase